MSDQISRTFILQHLATKAQPKSSRQEAQPSGHLGSTPQSMPETSTQGEAERQQLTAGCEQTRPGSKSQRADCRHRQDCERMRPGFQQLTAVVRGHPCTPAARWWGFSSRHKCALITVPEVIPNPQACAGEGMQRADFTLSKTAPLSPSLQSRETTAWVFPEDSLELSRDRAFHKDISLLSRYTHTHTHTHKYTHTERMCVLCVYSICGGVDWSVSCV